MPVAETIELVARLRAEVEVPLGVGDRQPRAARAVHARDEETFEALREPEAIALLTERAGGGRGRRCSTRPGSRCRCGARAPRTSTSCATTVDLPLLYVPYLFVRDHGLRVTRMVADALGEELGL